MFWNICTQSLSCDLAPLANVSCVTGSVHIAIVCKIPLRSISSHQYALVDVSVADALHADPDDARVGNLFVVEGLRGLRRAAGR